MVAEVSGAALDRERVTLFLGGETTQRKPIGQLVLFRLAADHFVFLFFYSEPNCKYTDCTREYGCVLGLRFGSCEYWVREHGEREKKRKREK